MSSRTESEERARPYSADRAISRREAADRLDICLRTLDNWRERGIVRSVRVGGRALIPESEVARLLFGRGVTANHENARGTDSRGACLSYADAFALDLAEINGS